MSGLHAVRVLATVLADTGDGGEGKKAGPIGLVVIVLLCVACYFLFKSMSKHLRKVRDDFPITTPADPLHQGVRPAKKSAQSVDGADPSVVPTGPPGTAQDDSGA